MKHRGSTLLWFLLPLLSLASQPVTASQRYALLIGIGNYEHVATLKGPKWDVSELEKLLLDDWGFKKGHIEILEDAQATRKRIMAALEHLVTESSPGDHIFLYYSGHGTSRLDLESDWPLPHTSGALIPVDFNPIGTIQEQMAQLIVGRWDIRPIIQQLDDGGRHVFAVVDACYSENAVRGGLSKPLFTPRYVRLRSTRGPGKRSLSSGLSDLNAQHGQATRKKEPYPFENTYFIAASGEYETAVDINASTIHQFPTDDNRLHGAFTDALLRVLRKRPDGDTNHNGTLEYGELYRAIRDFMDGRSYPHTPRALPLVAKDKNGLGRQAVFGLDGGEDADELTGSTGSPNPHLLRVRITGLPALRKTLSHHPSLRLVDDHADLSIVRDQDQALLLRPSGDRITNLPATDVAAIYQGVEQQLWVRALGPQTNPNQQYNITLDLSGDRQAGLLVKGEQIGLTVSTERDAYIMLIDIDPAATATVLYPGSRSEVVPLKAGGILTIPDPDNPSDHIEVRGPFGTDYIIALAFTRKPKDLHRLVGATVPSDSPLRPLLDGMVNSREKGVARAVLQVVTQE